MTTSLNPISLTLDTGSAQFAGMWRRWVGQWTQPQLMRLSSEYLRGRLFHSSQMSGFSERRLRSPAPQVFLAVGFMNMAHGRSLGYEPHRIEEVADIGLPEKLPETLRDLWEAREPLCDASGVVMGPVGLFEAFTGLRALSALSERYLAPSEEVAAGTALGRWLRLRLATRGVDWVTELEQLSTRSEVAEPLLRGRRVPGPQLIDALPELAALVDATADQAWEVIKAGLEPKAQVPAAA